MIWLRKRRYDEKTATTGPAVQRPRRALRPRSEPPPIASDAGPLLRRPSGGEEVAGGADDARGVRFVDAGALARSDAVRIGDVLHRVRVDALGARAGDGLVRGGHRVHSLRLGAIRPLLCHGFANLAKGHNFMEAAVKRTPIYKEERTSKSWSLKTPRDYIGAAAAAAAETTNGNYKKVSSYKSQSQNGWEEVRDDM